MRRRCKAYLQECLRQITALVDSLGLTLNHKTQIFPVRQGMDFLGFHLYLTDTGKVVKRLRGQNKKKLKRRLTGLAKGYASGRLEIEDITRGMAATNGHLQHGHTWKLRENLYSQTTYIRKSEEERI